MDVLGTPSQYGLEHHGLTNLKAAYWNLPAALLVEQVIGRNEGVLSDMGAVVVNTGKHTGRAPNDKFIVSDAACRERVWWGKVNQPLSVEQFERLYQKVCKHLEGKEVFIQDMQAGAHPNWQRPIRIITEMAWQSLFARDLFRRVSPDQLKEHVPEYTLICVPGLEANPEEDGTRSGTFIVISFERKLVLIGGSSYAGEIKKSIFTVMNYELPPEGALSMHCSANVGPMGDVALFFGLSGTGKTSLSSDRDRRLIGDDEHGWGPEGVFNFEGGCYAKMIRLCPDIEPVIWGASRRFGSVLENVIYDPLTRVCDFDDESRTENTRGAYPLDYVENHIAEGYAGHPENIFFLMADAFGVMPPIARLNPWQAMYYFLSGYTSKLAGTEDGLGKEPQATFSTCFAAPFLPLHPGVYAELLGQKIARHNVNVWLVNTGWTGGPYGIGSRIRLPYTRAMVCAALSYQLDNVSFHKEPYFGLWIPDTCPGVPAEILDPIKTWADPAEYEAQAKGLAESFAQNFTQFQDAVAREVTTAGP